MATERCTRIPAIADGDGRPDGLKSYAHALYKYGIGPTKEGPYYVANRVRQQGKFGQGKALGGRARVQKHVLQKKDVGDVPAEDMQNPVPLLFPIGVGMPAQTLKLDIDTGSADLWLWRVQDAPASHTVSDAALREVGTDVVTLGSLTIEEQTIRLVRGRSDRPVHGAGDGVLGLAWGDRSSSSIKNKTIIKNMMAQASTTRAARLFTAHIGSTKDPNSESFYTFGHMDQAVLNKFGDNFHYVDIDSSSHGLWQFASGRASIVDTSGHPVTIDRGAHNTAIVDTSTALVLVADAVVDAIYAAVPGSTYDPRVQGYVFPRSVAVDRLPTVSFAVGQRLFAVRKEHLAFADTGDNGMVYGGIQSRGDLSFDVLGQTFLKAVYAVFDYGNSRFGVLARMEP